MSFSGFQIHFFLWLKHRNLSIAIKRLHGVLPSLKFHSWERSQLTYGVMHDSTSLRGPPSTSLAELPPPLFTGSRRGCCGWGLVSRTKAYFQWPTLKSKHEFWNAFLPTIWFEMTLHTNAKTLRPTLLWSISCLQPMTTESCSSSRFRWPCFP